MARAATIIITMSMNRNEASVGDEVAGPRPVAKDVFGLQIRRPFFCRGSEFPKRFLADDVYPLEAQAIEKRLDGDQKTETRLRLSIWTTDISEKVDLTGRTRPTRLGPVGPNIVKPRQTGAQPVSVAR